MDTNKHPMMVNEYYINNDDDCGINAFCVKISIYSMPYAWFYKTLRKPMLRLKQFFPFSSMFNSFSCWQLFVLLCWDFGWIFCRQKNVLYLYVHCIYWDQKFCGCPWHQTWKKFIFFFCSQSLHMDSGNMDAQ